MHRSEASICSVRLALGARICAVDHRARNNCGKSTRIVPPPAGTNRAFCKAMRPFLLGTLSSILVTHVAAADPSALATRARLVAPAGTDTATSEPLTERSRGAFRGFYLRLSAGAGAMGVSIDPEPGYAEDSTSDAAVSFDALLGASVFRGGAVGGALLLDAMPSLRVTFGQNDGSKPAAIGVLGPFFELFPDPELGWHLGGAVGLAAASVEAIDAQRHRLVGPGSAVWAGNDFWVFDDWALGARLRLAYTRVQGDAGAVDMDAASLAGSLMLSAVHH
jgi:hypothetical protein